MSNSRKWNRKSALRVGALVILFSGFALLIGIPLQGALNEGTIALGRGVAYRVTPATAPVSAVTLSPVEASLPQIDWLMDDEQVQLTCFVGNCLTPMIKDISRDYDIDTIVYSPSTEGKWSQSVLLTVRPR